MLPFDNMSLTLLVDYFPSILLFGLLVLILIITAKDIMCGMRKPFLDPTQVRFVCQPHTGHGSLCAFSFTVVT